MIRDLLQNLYDATIRPLLPRKVVVHNGVAVRSGRLLDATDEKPDYEGSLVAAIRERVDPGDDVVVAGGGHGVSAVVAARRVGSSGSVVVFEGATAQVRMLKETVVLNRVAEEVEVRHAVVASGNNLWDDRGDAASVAPSELPDCDVLVLDCEGAELQILSAADLPPTVIVETHGIFDAPTQESRRLLEDAGLSIVEDRVEFPSEDVHVLTAVRR